MDKTKKTEKSYGFLWSRVKADSTIKKWHFNAMQETINEPIVTGSRGIEVGCGCGYDTYIMSKNNPSVELISVDISDGVYVAKRISSGLKNVKIVKSSIQDLPIKNDVFDFAYSFGVIHHTANPKKCLMEVNRILKKGKPVFLYLYEDHADNAVKYFAIKLISQIRKFTVLLPCRATYILSLLFSPFIFIIFTLPSKILKKFKATRRFSDKIPFNFGRGLFSLRGDIYDRFSAPIEHRFSREGVYNILAECGFSKITITKFNGISGWVAWGFKE